MPDAGLFSNTAVLTLAELGVGQSAIVVGTETGTSTDSDVMSRRLAEIGFLPGERVRVLRRVPGGEPMAVRIGSSTFALRRHEAACVQVQPEHRA